MTRVEAEPIDSWGGGEERQGGSSAARLARMPQSMLPTLVTWASCVPRCRTCIVLYWLAASPCGLSPAPSSPAVSLFRASVQLRTCLSRVAGSHPCCCLLWLFGECKPVSQQ